MHRTPDGSRSRVLVRTIAGSALVSALTLVDPTGGAPAQAAAGEDPAPAAVWPVDPHPVVAAYDPPGCQFCAGHRGVDLGTLPLQLVRAAVPGTVTYANVLAGRGVVVVDDGLRRFTYEPVAATVTKGAVVRAGDVLGVVELAGSHCYPEACLHLGLVDDASDDYLDPLTAFALSSEIRLLPLWADGVFDIHPTGTVGS